MYSWFFFFKIQYWYWCLEDLELIRLSFRWNGEKILLSQPTLRSGEGFLCNIWGHYFIVLIICLFCNFSLKFTSILSIHPSHSCTSHHYVVGTLSHIKWVSSEYATSLKIVHQCWLVGCNLWLNDKKACFWLEIWNPLSKMEILHHVS